MIFKYLLVGDEFMIAEGSWPEDASRRELAC